MLPRIGRPGGAGIGADMMADSDNSNHRKIMQQRAKREKEEKKGQT